MFKPKDGLFLNKRRERRSIQLETTGQVIGSFFNLLSQYKENKQKPRQQYSFFCLATTNT